MPASLNHTPATDHVRPVSLACVVACTCVFLGAVTALAPAADAQVTRTVREPNSNPSGNVTASPNRFEKEVRPGQTIEEELKLFNDSPDAVDVTIETTDLGPASDPRSLTSKVENGEYGAGDWITPGLRDLRLAPFEEVTLPVLFTPPAQPTVGTSFAGILVKLAPAKGAIGLADQQGGFTASELNIQAFLTVPGDEDHDLRIISVEAVDALSLGRTRFAVWEVTYDNRGTTNEHVEGSARIRSIFGNRAGRVPLEQLIVLRGARRTQRVVWSDVPRFGAFTPEVKVRGDDAREVERDGERIVILPPPWVFIVLAATIILGISWRWWQRRREWRGYLEEDWDAEDPDAWEHGRG